LPALFRDPTPGDHRDAEALMRRMPRLLAFALVVVCMLVGAGCGAFVGGKLTEPSPTPTAVVAVASPEPTDGTSTAVAASASSTASTTTVDSPPASVVAPSPRATATTPAATRVPAVPNTPNAVAAGNLTLSATYANIGIELFFVGDDNGNATANVEFRPTGAADWRAGLPLWRTGPGKDDPRRAFYGSILLLDAGTKYDLRITMADPDGVRGDSVVVGTTATRADNLPTASSLKPTHFVSPTGDDEADGSAGHPWLTLDKALKDAPAGAIVRVAPGSYAPPTVAREEPLTIVAEHPAVDDNREPINAGMHSVVEPQTFSSPGEGAWVKVTLKGPATGQDYTVWKWANSPVADATRLTVATDRGAVPQRIAYWALKDGESNGYTMQTPEGWAEVLYRNETYNYGFTAFGNDLYARLPGDRDPNTFFVAAYAEPDGPKARRWNVYGEQVRISGFEIRSIDVWYQPDSSGGVVDHNLFLLASLSHRAGSDDNGGPSTYSSDQLVQYNRFVDTGTWSTDPAWPAIPWNFVKSAIRINGKATDWSRIGSEAETGAVGGRGGAHRLVVRYNTIDGFFNGVGGYNQGFDRYAQQDNDMYDNLLRHIADDSFEPEQQGINWRIWNNRLEYVSTALSTGPLAYGPVYFFRNEIWQLGAAGVGADGSGNKGVGVVGFKYSGNSEPAARIFVINNTFWTNDPGADGGNQYAGGGPNSERFYLRNNIFRMTRYGFAAPSNTPGTADHWDEDFNFFATTATDRGVSYGGSRTSVGGYRSASGQGANSNRGDQPGTFHTEPGLVDPGNGNLALAPGSPQIDAGTPVPNISDRPGIDYRGNAPDLGAREVP
jgi:Protein of unknown function (DUF1565)